jgi:hypothetical protein
LLRIDPEVTLIPVVYVLVCADAGLTPTRVTAKAMSTRKREERIRRQDINGSFHPLSLSLAIH